MDPEQVWAALERLIGDWEGQGVGWFPTIDDFAYRESISIEGGSVNRQLRFNQTSFRLTEDGERESHSEAGFIAMAEDGTVEMAAAEALDRVEILTGSVAAAGNGFVLELETTAVVHDDRVIRSWRRYVFGGDDVTYTMGMATTAVPEGDPHLEGRLTRVRAG